MATVTKFYHENTSVTTVDIPSTLGDYPVTSIVERAFTGCSSLTSVTIPSSVTSIEVNPFYDCSKLISISVDTNNSNFSSSDGVLFNKDKTTLIAYPNSNGNTYTIPSSVTSIGNYAFGYCSSLTSVTIPSSVTSIGDRAFYFCNGLTSVTISSSVTSIGDRAFYFCNGLTSVTIPSSVTSIGDWAFSFCDGLTSVTILNPDCTIYDSSYTINSTATIYGYVGSTANTYATNYNRTFVEIESNTNITFNQTGGSGGTELTTAKYGYSMSNITVPSKTGYKFIGYYDAETGGTQYYNADRTSAKTWDKLDESATLYAQWAVKTIEVTFYRNLNSSDTTTASQTFTYGVSGQSFSDKGWTNTGYTLSGWYHERECTTGGYFKLSGVADDFIDINSPSVNLYAKWTANTDTKYTVKHWTQNLGAAADQNDINYTLADTDNLTGTTGANMTPAVKSYTGFTAPSTQTVSILADGSRVVNYYYTRNSYTYTLGSGTGVSTSGSTASGTYQYGATITLQATANSGYEWNQWISSNMGLVANTNNASTTFTMPAGNVTMTPSATIINYTITYNLNDGTQESGATTGYNVTTPTFNLPIPTKTGYTFGGWYTASDFSGSAVSQITTGTTGNKTYYAKWTANTYIIKFNGNGNTNTEVNMSDLSMTYDVEKALTENAYEKTGYNFIGWSKTSTGTVEYIDKATVENLTSTNGDTVTLYAQWEIKVLSVNYVHKLYSVDSGKIEDMSEVLKIETYLPASVNYGKEIDLTGRETTYDSKTIYRAPTCDGYIFCGWYTDIDLTTPAFSKDNGKVTITENTTLYAKWIPVGEMTLSQDDKYKRTDESGNASGFEMYGVQVRMKDDGVIGRGMRFVTRIRADLLNEIRIATGHEEKKCTNPDDDSFEPYDENASYGYLMKAQTSFADPIKCNSDPLQMVEVAANINNGRYADFGNYFLFTGVITNIEPEKFDTNFSATAYIKYIDANGVERRYCYTESSVEYGANSENKGVYHTNLRKAAKAYLESPIKFTNAQLNYLNYIVSYGQ